MYGLNPTITAKDNPNSPFYESPCDFCRQKGCEGCEYSPEQKDEDLEIFEAQTEMYQDNL